MVEPRKCPHLPAGGTGFRSFFLLLLFLGGLAFTARAVPRFDVFPGYDGIVSEASWFPVVCEVMNDGPSFVGVIEVESGQFNQGQTRRVVVELPTGTLKRIVIPVFSTTRYQSRWDFRLLDERGKVRAEQLGIQPKRQLAAATPLLGALPKTAGGLPVIRQTLSREPDLQPASARLQTTLLPDNPLMFEGMDTIYLNSEKAVDLSATQVEALLSWLNDGGHLIIGVEQVGDVNGVPWLQKLVPFTLTDQQTVGVHGDLHQWLRGSTTNAEVELLSQSMLGGNRGQGGNARPFADLPEDSTFESAPLQVATGTQRGGQVMVWAGSTPLMVRSNVGRGRVTTLLFSPEREPVRSWKNLPTFWAKLAGVPPEEYTNENVNNQRGGWSIDGVFGAMIDSKQVRKLPVEWLLLLLIVYLVVIGPLDQYWLKRIRRPMLTWVTFPCYVVLFSLLIYFIGYKLRAGESEWNELHLVDVLVNGQEAELRGHTYASIYSPVNAEYQVASEQKCATFRGEFQGSWSGGQESEKADVFSNGDNYKAKIFVPVWTSQLYVSDWWEPAPLPMDAVVTGDSHGWSVKVNNKMDRPLTHAQLVVGDRVMDLGELPPRQTKTFKFGNEQRMSLRDFVGRYGGNFLGAAQSRQHAFGNSSSAQISDLPNASIAASFLSQTADQGQRFIAPPGFDLSETVAHGNAVLLAWCADYSPIKPINQFSPRRLHKDTLWRMAVPVNAP